MTVAGWRESVRRISGAAHADGPLRVFGSDPYDLDRDGDGIAGDTCDGYNFPVLSSIRRAVVAVVAMCAATGCGAQPARETAWVPAGGASTVPSGPASPAGPAPPSASAAPARTGSPTPAPARTTAKATAPARTTAASTAAAGGLRISNLVLTVPDENGFGKVVRAIHQDGCGSPTTANISYTITVPGGRWRQLWYEYEVDAPAPLQGKSDFYEFVRNGDRSTVKTVIGPLARKAANTAGGTLTITVVVLDDDTGSRVTARLTATLLPCG